MEGAPEVVRSTPDSRLRGMTILGRKREERYSIGGRASMMRADSTLTYTARWTADTRPVVHNAAQLVRLHLITVDEPLQR